MLDQLYSQQALEADLADSSIRTTKRRKTDGINPTDGDDEDVMYYGHGKKAKSSSGIGYDGDATEDVGCLFFEISLAY